VGSGAIELVNALGRRLLEASPGRITGQNVCQWLRIDIAVQRGNAPSMRGTFPAAASAGVVFYAVECGWCCWETSSVASLLQFYLSLTFDAPDWNLMFLLSCSSGSFVFLWFARVCQPSLFPPFHRLFLVTFSSSSAVLSTFLSDVLVFILQFFAHAP